MTIVCAWCRSEFQTAEPGPGEPYVVTRGICARCRERVLNEERDAALRGYLDLLHSPVLLVDRDAVVRAASADARAVLGKAGRDVEGLLVGKVMECVYSHWPGGCGKTFHCQTCPIRRSVTATFATGRSLEDVLCYQDVRTPSGVRRRRLFVSTERANDAVLLRIDSVADVPDGGTVP